MDKGLVCRTAQNGEEFCEWDADVMANPRRSSDGRLLYSEHQLQRSEYYEGCLDDWPIEEIRRLLPEMIAFAGLSDSLEMQLPPAGLPGQLHKRYDRDSPEADLLLLGMQYLSAIANNERRTMHNRWQEARDFIYKIEQAAEERVFDRLAQRRIEEDRANAKRMASQTVYFIASESGPIKIGIAVSPDKRLRGLQTGHHERLELLATCEGGQERERDYHKRFAAHRLHGEWFERVPEIELEIARLNKDTPTQ